MPPKHEPRLHVLLTTEGTYPFALGGVSTWCDTLTRGVHGVDFTVFAVVAHPHEPLRYAVPAGTRLITVPLWGTEDPAEHLATPASVLYGRKLRTDASTVCAEFLPLFAELLQLTLADSPDGRRAGAVFYDLYRLFQLYDYKMMWKSEETWEYFVAALQTAAPALAGERPSLHEALQMLGWLYRFLVVLNTPVPRSDVVHASAAACCGLPGVLAKLERKTPFLLTEHGVYLREQYLNVGKAALPPASRQFLLQFVQLIVATNYAYADLVAPVCAFNSRWERRLGVDADRIEVNHNGVAEADFAPQTRPAGGPPTVVSVARIDPVKDIRSLLRAAAHVRQAVPDACFTVYGNISVPDYYRACLELRSELGLDDCFTFAGHVATPADAYHAGDVAVLSSVTEGFPFAVVEAMMAGLPVVATDVGGTHEALGGTGLLVPPQRPQQLAGAIVRLLRDPALRQELAAKARRRALLHFTAERNLARYGDAYRELVTGTAAAEGGF